MSVGYDEYLVQHKANVAMGLKWLKANLPEVTDVGLGDHLEWQICVAHDASKSTVEEYDAYDKYFYGRNKSYEVVNNFRLAWLHHIHVNPHHWQHWVLVNDDPKEGTIALDMPYVYIVEMICDWWSFSWKKGNLREIFSWYDDHKEHMILSDKTRKTVEEILAKIKVKLEETKL